MHIFTVYDHNHIAAISPIEYGWNCHVKNLCTIHHHWTTFFDKNRDISRGTSLRNSKATVGPPFGSSHDLGKRLMMCLSVPYEIPYETSKVKADCRELLRGTAIQWEKAVLHERKALKDWWQGDMNQNCYKRLFRLVFSAPSAPRIRLPRIMSCVSAAPRKMSSVQFNHCTIP